jgi:RNA polymerase sigma-70 factor (ECF subfamily)
VDAHRRRARTPLSVEYDPGEDLRRTESAEERALDAMADSHPLLESLPDDYREVLALRVIAELSLESTARIMGKSTGAIKQLQRRAVARLKDAQLNKKGQVGP